MPKANDTPKTHGVAKARSTKVRADHWLVHSGLCPTRAKAQAWIMAGQVFFNHGQRVEKPGQMVAVDANIMIKKPDHPWVSRGGMKLDHAIQTLKMEVRDKICADIGASTGGFTDVLLHHGAKKIYAVDVGYGQLHPKIRQHPFVVVLEKTNARYLTVNTIPEALDIVVCDASFISLTKILPNVLDLVKPSGALMALIKPQFEAARSDIKKGGVVKDPLVHKAICQNISTWLETQGWVVNNLIPSPILGPKGNQEFLIYAAKLLDIPNAVK